MIRLTFIFTCVLCTSAQWNNVRPSYDNVKAMLHERISEIFNGDNDEIRLRAESGKFFRYSLPHQNSAGLYKAYEGGKMNLPHWLTFNSNKNKLMGIPTKRDIQNGLKIEFRRRNENGLNEAHSFDSFFIIIDVIPPRRQFFCGKEPATVASLIYHADLKILNGHERTKILRKIVNNFDNGIHDFIMEEGNQMDGQDLLTSSVRMAGPGDPVTDEQPGFTVSWKLKCSFDIAGDKTVSKLREFSANEKFAPLSSLPILGWFVYTIKGNRIRRAVRSSGTPGVGTPSVSGGTPTLSASPSVTAKSSSMVIPLPSKTSVPVMTSTAITTTSPSTTTTTSTDTTKKEIDTTTTTKISTTKKNSPPEVVSSIEDVIVSENQGMIFMLPVNTFFDVDGDELQIQLLHEPTKERAATPIGRGDYWIEYKDDNLYMFPTSQFVGVHRFIVRATDQLGAYANAMFEVRVQRDDAMSYNNIFNLTLSGNFQTVNNSVQEKIELLNTIAIAQGVDDYKRLKAVEFLPGSIIVRWSIDTLKNVDECNSPELITFINNLKSGSFKESFAPNTVLNFGMIEREECLGGDVLATPTEGGTWQRILIPVVVVVIILIIILLVLCCVCRRKRKYETSSDEEIYLNQKKKPIIFEEEKHKFLSLTSASLSDDAPTIDKSYGDSDGPGSSTTVSTESEGKALIAPNSPKDTSRGYNSPPPYGS